MIGNGGVGWYSQSPLLEGTAADPKENSGTAETPVGFRQERENVERKS
jgi:hypothetical protein